MPELAEAELAAYLFWQLDARVPAPFVRLLRSYAMQQLSHRLTRQDLYALSQPAARLLCRAHIERAVAEFTAWTPLAGYPSGHPSMPS